MPLFEVISLALLSALVWLWFDGSKARDIAIRAARDACLADGLQLLDETVSTSSIRPDRNDAGRLVLRRNYRFEYSDTGDNRRPGSVVLLGNDIVMVNVGLRVLH